MRDQVTTAPTAAQRLATATAGIAALNVERSAARQRMTEAQSQLEQLSAKRAALELAHDLHGEDMGLSLASIADQERAAAAALQAASVAERNYANRVAAVEAELPRIEAAVAQDELAAAVARGTEAARIYREAAEAFVAAGLTFQRELGIVAAAEDSLARKGNEPRHKLRAHLLQGKDIDWVFAVAREGGSLAAAKASRDLWSRWRL